MSGLNSEYRNMISEMRLKEQLNNPYKSEYDTERNIIVSQQNIIASHQQKNNRHESQQKNNRHESEETRLKEYRDRLAAHPMRERKRV
jgi:hypothetical protein